MDDMDDPNFNPWPEDMERRRLADIEKYLLKHPDRRHLFGDAQQISPNGKGVARSPTSRTRSRKTPRREAKRSPSRTRSRKSPRRELNRWDLATTLELLDGMKHIVRTQKFRLGESVCKWDLVAAQLSNPNGLEPGKFARSCEVRFSNIRRLVRGSKKGFVDEEVRRSLDEFSQLVSSIHRTKSSPSAQAQGYGAGHQTLSNRDDEEDTVELKPAVISLAGVADQTILRSTSCDRGVKRSRQTRTRTTPNTSDLSSRTRTTPNTSDVSSKTRTTTNTSDVSTRTRTKTNTSDVSTKAGPISTTS